MGLVLAYAVLPFIDDWYIEMCNLKPAEWGWTWELNDWDTYNLPVYSRSNFIYQEFFTVHNNKILYDRQIHINHFNLSGIQTWWDDFGKTDKS